MLKTIFVQLHGVDLKDKKTYKGIEGFEELISDLQENQVEVLALPLDYGQKTGTGKEEWLVISDYEAVIDGCHDMQIPTLAYDNKELGEQDLFKADMLAEGFWEIDYRFVLEVYQRYHQLPIVIAETKRLIIREMTLADLDELYELYAHESIIRFLEPLYEREEEEEFTRAYIKNMYGFYGYGLWTLIQKETGRLIGRAGLSNREVDGEIQMELGYVIGGDFQRQGYAYEACMEILRLAVKRFDCHSLNCFIQQDNKASVALVKKLGFHYEQEAEINGEKMLWYRWTCKEEKDII
ncbi:GNAT family N-acetyltransferase [Konateibacter massiliensis]|uniref:GNAT family N-acetyltransferase n=1 Tax=Konateibacter massiliensis TaxID=2002841 RepID=UPI000C147DA9|nr:GNAT family N-acetyltransferase [Konateibacter massiliensis]